MFLNYFRPTRGLSIASSVVLAVFLGLVSVSLFAYLGRRGQITSGRIYVSVSLYFLLGMECYVLYSLLNAVQPGSFAEAGVTLMDRVHAIKFLYFSLATLTTLGYGDIVAVRPAARMLAALEAAAGVLYICHYRGTIGGLLSNHKPRRSSGMICGFSLGQERLIRVSCASPRA